jgi:PadR family transcriptional regulator PadR
LRAMDTPVSAKAALLQVLTSGDGYGLELIERVKDHTKGRLRLHQGSVYPALRELEREGFVTSYEGEPLPERGGRPRRFYRLTAQGKRALATQRDVVLGLFGIPLVGAK